MQNKTTEIATIRQAVRLHSNTAHGAKCSAALYSIVATAQANGLNTEQYLTELFSQPPGTIFHPFNTLYSDRLTEVSLFL